MSPLLISWLLAAAPAVVQADSLKFPLGLATGPDRALYVSERDGHRVVRIDPNSGGMRVVAGTGVPGFRETAVPPPTRSFAVPTPLISTDAGNLYIADRCNERLRVVEWARSSSRAHPATRCSSPTPTRTWYDRWISAPVGFPPWLEPVSAASAGTAARQTLSRVAISLLSYGVARVAA